MANIHSRVCAELGPPPEALMAICERVSPRLTTCVPSPGLTTGLGDVVLEPRAREGRALLLDVASAGVDDSAGAGAGGAGREICPSCAPAPAAGAATGAFA